MFVLRSAHVEALAHEPLRRGRALIAAWMVEHHPERFGLLSEEELARAAEARVDRALAFGFTSVTEVVRYLDCALRFEDDFPDAAHHLSCSTILHDNGFTAAEKLHLLETVVFPEMVPDP